MKQLGPKVVWIFFFSFVLRTFMPIVFLSIWFLASLGDFAGIFNEENGLSLGFLKWLWLIVPAFLVICYVWARLTYHFYRYELLEGAFRKESGVIYKKYVTIPYDRIQNIDIDRGILARILGLSDLHIQTAGASATFSRYSVAGAGSEGRLPGVSKAMADELRDELVKRTRQTKSQGL